MSVTLPTPDARADDFPVERVRHDFPILDQEVGSKPLVYLDNAASAQKPRAVIEALNDYYRRDHANIHRGVHALSQRATDRFEKARERVAAFLGAAEPAEIVFTRGATEAINLVAHSFGRLRFRKGDNIILTQLEHHANIVPWQLAREYFGIEIRVLPCDDAGVLDVDALPDLIDERTRLLGMVHISNALGHIHPAKEMIATAHAAGVPVLLDAAQSVPHGVFDVQELDADFVVFSGHKVYGPTGIGALYGKRKWLEEMPPYQGGGDMILKVRFEQTRFKGPPEKFEAGTPAIGEAIGLAAGIAYLQELGQERVAGYEQIVRDEAEAKLAAIEGVRIIGGGSPKASVVSFLLDDVHPHDVGTYLDNEGIAVRTGHHCCQPLMARLGLTGTVRASFSFYNTREEAARLVDAVRACRAFFAT